MKTRKSILRRSLASFAVVLYTCFAASSAMADFIFSLTVPNTALSGYPSPYASVDVHLIDPTHATITFTALASGGYSYFFGAAQAADVNVNATSFTVGSLSALTLSFGGANNVDGFGLFNLTLDNFDGYSNELASIGFMVTDDSGTWATASDVLIANAGGSLAAAHIFVNGASCGNTACATGFVGNGTNTDHQIPEPSTLLLLAGAGLIGVGAWARRRQRGLLRV